MNLGFGLNERTEGRILAARNDWDPKDRLVQGTCSFVEKADRSVPAEKEE